VQRSFSIHGTNRRGIAFCHGKKKEGGGGAKADFPLRQKAGVKTQTPFCREKFVLSEGGGTKGERRLHLRKRWVAGLLGTGRWDHGRYAPGGTHRTTLSEGGDDTSSSRKKNNKDALWKGNGEARNGLGVLWQPNLPTSRK